MSFGDVSDDCPERLCGLVFVATLLRVKIDRAFLCIVKRLVVSRFAKRKIGCFYNLRSRSVVQSQPHTFDVITGRQLASSAASIVWQRKPWRTP